MPRFSLGDVGEARWPLSQRKTDTSPILPDATHDSRNQGRVVINTSYQKLPFGSGDYPDKLLYHQALN